MSRSSRVRFDCLAAMRALAEESRLKLVRRLLAGPCCVNDLCDSLGLTPYNASKHLRVLREAGLVAMEKQSQQHVYALAAGLRRRLRPGTQTLDLGCCQFHLDKIQD
jgi:DNA-binding transcriptional ArsR family regulator